MRFLVRADARKSLSRINDVLEFEGKGKVDKPEEIICKSWLFPIKIWLRPSKGEHCWMFLELLVT